MVEHLNAYLVAAYEHDLYFNDDQGNLVKGGIALCIRQVATLRT